MRALRSGALMHDLSEKHIELDQRPTLGSACGAFRSVRCGSPPRAGSPLYRFSGPFLCGHKAAALRLGGVLAPIPPVPYRSALRRATTPEGKLPRPNQLQAIAGPGPPLGAHDHLTARLEAPPRCRWGDFVPPQRVHHFKILRKDRKKRAYLRSE